MALAPLAPETRNLIDGRRVGASNGGYGLSGAVHSASEERALAVARRVRTGTISVNGGQWFHVDSPFGGYKQSGVGRENDVAGFEKYLETKVIALPRRKA